MFKLEEEVGIDAELNAANFRRALKLEPIDRVPVWLFLDSAFYPWYAGMKDYEYRLNPEKMLAAQLMVRKRFYNLVGCAPVFGMASEAPAYGCVVRWSSKDPPWIKPRIKKPEEVMEIEPPDPRTDGLFPLYIQFYKYMLKHAPGAVALYGFIRCPVTVAALVRGISGLLADMWLQPEYAKRLIEVCTDTSIKFIKVLREELGELGTIFLDDDISGFLSPKLFEEFSYSYLKRIIDSYRGPVYFYHGDANTTHLLELIADTGINAFNISFQVDAVEAKKRIGDRVCIVGNIPPLEVLMRGTPEDVDRCCRDLIKKAAPHGGFVLGPGGDIFKGTPLENIDAMIRAVVKYGKYPIKL